MKVPCQVMLVAVLMSCHCSSLATRSQSAGDSALAALLAKLLKSGKPSTVEQHMALNRLILDEIASQSQSLNSSRVAFFNEETVAVLTYADTRVASCKLMEVNLRSDLVTVLKNLTNYMPVYPMETKKMVRLVSQCQHVGEALAPQNRRSTAARVFKEDANSTWSFLTAIVPGTKWCGPGYKAQSYDDLGVYADVDKCCRAHDNCPIKVSGMGRAHGLINLSFYSKSHCSCDDEFFSCLKSLETPMARMIGNVYFNVIQVPCIEEEVSISGGFQPAKLHFLGSERCKSRNARNCRDPFFEQTYRFVQINREF